MKRDGTAGREPQPARLAATQISHHLPTGEPFIDSQPTRSTWVIRGPSMCAHFPLLLDDAQDVGLVDVMPREHVRALPD
jgi:hypothetical protein